MARRQYSGGLSPFPTQHRPSIFNRLPPEEFLIRRGEPVLWFPALPPVHAKPLQAGRLLSPDLHHTNKGYILTFQKNFRIAEESLAIQHHNTLRFRPAFAPIHKIHSVFAYRNALQGGNIHLQVKDIAKNNFTIEPHPQLRYWHEIRLDYEVLLYETRRLRFEKESASPIIHLCEHPELITESTGESLINVCVGVRSIENINEGNITNYHHDFTRIHLPETESKAASYMLELELYSPISIAYRTLASHKNTSSAIPIQAGELEAVASPYYPINEGDLIIMTRSQASAKELSHKRDDRFPLVYGPIASIQKLYAGTSEGARELDIDDAIIDGFHALRLKDPSIESISVSYNYHPQYRVKERLEHSALEGRRQPVKWRLSPEHSNLVFA